MSNTSLGSLQLTGIAAETTKGTYIAPKYWVKGTNGLYDNVTYAKQESPAGRLGNQSDSTPTQIWAEGDALNGEIHIDPLPEEFKAVLGGDPTTAKKSGVSVYDHTFVFQQNNNHKSLSVTYIDGLENLKYTGVMCNTYNLTCDLEGYAMRTMNAIGFKSTTGAGVKGTANNSPKFIAKDIQIRLATNVAGLATATPLGGTSFSLDISKNTSRLHEYGETDLTPNTIANGRAEASGTLSLYFRNTTEKAKVFAGTHNAISIKATKGSGASERGFEIILNDVSLEGFTRSNEASDFLTQEVSFMANDTGDLSKLSYLTQ